MIYKPNKYLWSEINQIAADATVGNATKSFCPEHKSPKEKIGQKAKFIYLC